MNKKIIFLLIICFSIQPVFAVPKNLPVPRFVTIKFNEVNARVGPEKDCPIEWVFIKKGEPVEVVAEYEQWRKIVDAHGEGGWVHSSVVSGKRSVIVQTKETIALRSSLSDNSNIVAYLKPNLRCNLLKCKEKWCKVSCQNKKGWLSRKYLWGVYPEE
ncbi:MAG: hypothetical protein DGJ47_000973 [Rickettsiaceae bacterium]